jgi:hypothetical protein
MEAKDKYIAIFDQQKKKKNFQLFFLIFGHQNPESESGSGFNGNAGQNPCAKPRIQKNQDVEVKIMVYSSTERVGLGEVNKKAVTNLEAMPFKNRIC